MPDPEQGSETVPSADSEADVQALVDRVADTLELPAEDQPSAFQRLRVEFPEHDDLLGRLEQAAAEIPSGPERTASITAWMTSTGKVAAASIDRIGPYKILERLGVGGMGMVYLAEQREPVRRRVAIKVIKLGMDSKQILARFEAERQALAMMEHSNIARVYDCGLTDHGQPYFAMEYVKGRPITKYCDDHRLDLKARLELFMQVCAGVQHAHNKGVIHRDLTPNNILVTSQDGKPTVKIIDFGLASATGHRLTEATIFTAQGQIMGTPDYMSPEQAGLSGLDIDTRTDVYTLGVLLYELLTSEVPFGREALRQAGLLQIQRVICEEEPQKPSTRITTKTGSDSAAVAAKRCTDLRTLARRLRGDLDWIVMQALDKDPNRRYGTANEFAADVRRHLEDVPVEASPPSMVYRVGKIVRRHKLQVVAGGLLCLSMVAGIATTTWQWRQARAAERTAVTERDRAQQQADVAQAVIDFLNDDLLGAVAPSAKAGQGKDVRMREVLDVAATKIEGKFEEQPEVEARVRDTLGSTYHALGELERAHPHLERALALHRRLRGDDHPDTLNSIHNMGYLLKDQGKLDEAEPLLREALEGRRRVLGNDDQTTLMSINHMGYLLHLQERFDEAELLYREALERRRRVLGDDHPETLTSIHNMGTLRWSQGRLDEAEPFFREALKGQRSHSTLGDTHRYTLRSINNLGVLLRNQGKPNEAEPLYREALAAKRRLFGDEHPETLISISNMGRLRRTQGKLDEAESHLREAVEGFRRSLGIEHSHTLTSISHLGGVLFEKGKFDEAEQYHREALEGQRLALGDEHAHTLTSLFHLGNVLYKRGKFDEAEKLVRELIDKRPATDPWYIRGKRILDTIRAARKAADKQAPKKDR
jgi:serine/threonine protein kinase/tetratricopeptide (TPR) repeat protein